MSQSLILCDNIYNSITCIWITKLLLLSNADESEPVTVEDEKESVNKREMLDVCFSYKIYFLYQWKVSCTNVIFYTDTHNQPYTMSYAIE